MNMETFLIETFDGKPKLKTIKKQTLRDLIILSQRYEVRIEMTP